MIGRYSDLFGTDELCVGWTLPIDVELPNEDAIVFHDLFQLRTTCRHHDIWRTRRRQTLAIDVGVIKKIRAIDDDALFSGWLAFQHLRAVCDARMLLDHFVAGAGGNVVTVGPDRRPRIVRKERP